MDDYSRECMETSEVLRRTELALRLSKRDLGDR
jgi:hypothetical protein